MTESYDVLLFDLGGVLVRATGNPVAADGTLPADDDFWRRWLLSPAVRDFESGRTSPEEFARAVAAEFELEVGPDEFLRRFRAWPEGFYPGTSDLIELVSRRFRLACLSNSNPVHWDLLEGELRLADLFEHRFASHLIGHVKPEREVFEHVVVELACEPSRVLFLDDNPLCVEGARKVGISAHRARGLEDAVRVLRRAGVLGEDDVEHLGQVFRAG